MCFCFVLHVQSFAVLAPIRKFTYVFPPLFFFFFYLEEVLTIIER